MPSSCWIPKILPPHHTKLCTLAGSASDWMSRNRGGGTSLAVQWLRLCASTAGGMGSIPGVIPGRGTKTPKPHSVAKKKKQKEKKEIEVEGL